MLGIRHFTCEKKKIQENVNISKMRFGRYCCLCWFNGTRRSFVSRLQRTNLVMEFICLLEWAIEPIFIAKTYYKLLSPDNNLIDQLSTSYFFLWINSDSFSSEIIVTIKDVTYRYASVCFRFFLCNDDEWWCNAFVPFLPVGRRRWSAAAL